MEWLSRPLLRRPLLFLLGLGVAIGAALLFQPHWVDLCTRMKTREFIGWNGQSIVRGEPCAWVSPATMAGTFLIGFGALMLIIGPIIFSLAHVIRHGFNWEYSRVETATSNLPMLSGVLYIVAGAGLAFLSGG
jgi:hypothetical protein